MLPKVIYIFNAIPITLLASGYIEGEKTSLKLIWNEKGSWKAKRILLKKTKAGGPILSDFKTYF